MHFAFLFTLLTIFILFFIFCTFFSLILLAREYFLKSIFSAFSCQLLTRSWSEANATRQNFKTNWQCEFSKLVHWVWKASERQSLSLVLPQSQLTQAALRVLLRSLEFALSWPANSGKFCLALFGKFSWRAFAAGDSDKYMRGCWGEGGGASSGTATMGATCATPRCQHFTCQLVSLGAFGRSSLCVLWMNYMRNEQNNHWLLVGAVEREGQRERQEGDVRLLEWQEQFRRCERI